ncbi:MAG: radical SAM protein, partial [Lentisphaerae bacterium]
LQVRFIRKMDTQSGKFWQVIGGEGGHCAACNRLRLTADGRIVPCLFSDLGYSVRELGPRQAIMAALGNKPESGTRSQNKFYHTGG